MSFSSLLTVQRRSQNKVNTQERSSIEDELLNDQLNGYSFSQRMVENIGVSYANNEKAGQEGDFE